MSSEILSPPLYRSAIEGDAVYVGTTWGNSYAPSKSVIASVTGVKGFPSRFGAAHVVKGIYDPRMLQYATVRLWVSQPDGLAKSMGDPELNLRDVELPNIGNTAFAPPVNRALLWRTRDQSAAMPVPLGSELHGAGITYNVAVTHGDHTLVAMLEQETYPGGYFEDHQFSLPDKDGEVDRTHMIVVARGIVTTGVASRLVENS